MPNSEPSSERNPSTLRPHQVESSSAHALPERVSDSSLYAQLGSAIVAIALMVALKHAAADALGRDAPFFLYSLAVMGSGWFGGWRASLLATFLGTLVNWYVFLPPHSSLTIESSTTLIQILGFVLDGLAVTGIIAAMFRSRARLRASTNLTWAILNSAPDAIIIMDEEQRILRWNPAAQAMFGHQLELVRGKPAAEVLFHTLVQTDGPPSQPSVSEKRVELNAYRADGSVFPAEYAVTQSCTDERITYTAHVRDISKRRAHEREREQALQREQQNRNQLERLFELAASLSTSLTRNEVANIVVDTGMRAANADTCTLYVRDDQTGSLELLSDRGVSAEIMDKIRTIPRSSDNPVFRTLETGKPVWVETEAEYLKYYPNLAKLQVSGPRAKAFWSVPLVVEGRPIGLLGMGFYTEQHFSEDERTFVETFTRHCAQALRRAERVERERQARAAAERTQSSLSTTLRSIGDAVLATDTRANVTFMNPIAEALTGYPESEARGLPVNSVFRIVNEYTRQKVTNPVDRVLAEGVVVGLANHTILLGRDGKETPIDDSGAPIRDENGVIHGAVLVFRDVSEKKKGETRRAFLADATATLSSSLDYRRTLGRLAQLIVPTLADFCAVDVVEDGQRAPQQLAVAHTDPTKVEFARELGRRYPPNPNAKTGVPNVLRTGRAELYPEIPEVLLREGAVDAEHLKLIQELGLRSAMVVPLIARGQVLGTITFVFAESGRNYGSEDLEFAEDLAQRAAIAVDNARLYSAERAARQIADVANHAKDEFLATVSHELRTPLNAILGWAKLISVAHVDPNKHARAVEIIERNAVAMAQLIEDLLDVSRIVSGKIRLEMHPIDLARVIDAAIESAKPAIDAKELRLERTYHIAVAPVFGDASRLQQVVWNLLSNAVKFTPKGGRIEVVLRRLESSVELRVSDTGKGVNIDFLPHVFEPFRQADGKITRSHGGLGLGLAICRQLIDLHGGQIKAQSDGEGTGSTFIVILPVSAVRYEEPSAKRKSTAEPRTRAFERPPVLVGLKVLIVDDEDDARHLLRSILEECGARVLSASNVSAALQLLEHELPDVLISDIGMPVEDGYDLIRKVRALPPERGGRIPAAALTAYARAEDRRQMLDAGYLMHVPKPVEPAELVSIIASLARFDQN